MSTLVVSNISDGTTTVGASYVTNGSAKAWAKVTYSGGTPTVGSNSVNISSLSDRSTGNYDVNFATSMNSADYIMQGAVWNDRVGQLARYQANYSSSSYTVTVCDTRNGAEIDWNSGVSFQGVLA